MAKAKGSSTLTSELVLSAMNLIVLASYWHTRVHLLPPNSREGQSRDLASKSRDLALKSVTDLLPPISRFSASKNPFFRDFVISRLFDDLLYHQSQDVFLSRD